MIINFHPKEIESKKGASVIATLHTDSNEEVVHSTDKTADEWRAIIKSDEKLTLVAPVYWWGASYEFDKWVQDVFTYGFGYQYKSDGMPEGLLGGRAFEMHMTHGTPMSMAGVMQDNIKLRMEKGIFGFCDSKVAITFYEIDR